MKLIKWVNTKYFGWDTGNMQWDATSFFEINENIEFFGEEVDKFPICEMARKSTPQILKQQACLKYINKGGKELHNKEKIYKLCQFNSEVLDVKYKTKCQNGKLGNNSSCNHSNPEACKKKNNVPCPQHDGAHN